MFNVIDVISCMGLVAKTRVMVVIASTPASHATIVHLTIH